MKVILVVLALCAVAFAQRTTIDDFTVPQPTLAVNAITPSDSTLALSSSIYGGSRATTLDLDSRSAATCGDVKQSSTSTLSENGFLDADGNGVNDNPGDAGIFIAANDQSCFAKTLITYDGTVGTAFTSPESNFNNVGSALRFLYYSDISNRQVIIRVASGSTTCQVTLTTTGNQIIDDKTIAFTSFPGGCDFSSISRLEIEIPAQSNFDVTISIFEFISTSLSGRVYVDCGCDNSFNGADQPISGATVTVTPGANCASGTPSRTTTTNSDGTYRVNGLSACQYTVSPAVTTFTACSTSTRSATTVLGTETSNVNINYRGTSSFIVPDNVEVLCTQSTDPINTGTATTSSLCDGGRTVEYTDTPSAGNCDARGTISRRWTDGVNAGTQIITIRDTQVGPTLICPGPAFVECDASLLAANTGRPTVSDDCSRDIDVTYTGVDVDGQCDGSSCTRNKIVTRTFRAIDDCGNEASSTCTQTITITPCASAKTCPSPPNCHSGSIFYRDGVAQN